MVNLFMNNIFLSVLLAASISQLAKIIISKFKHKKRFNLNYLFITGGMPSTHSSLVGSLITIIWLTQGATPLFFVILTFSSIILMDSVGIRRSVGEEGKAIEEIIKIGKMEVDKFNYALGHNFIEMLVGLVVGISSAIFIYNLF